MNDCCFSDNTCAEIASITIRDAAKLIVTIFSVFCKVLKSVFEKI